MMRAFLVSTALLTAAVAAQAGILDGPHTYDGHTYYLLETSSWDAAQAEAVSLGGGIVSVNDATENQFVLDTFGSLPVIGRRIFIGLSRPPGVDHTDLGNWAWTDGTGNGYSNFQPGQPDNNGGAPPEELVSEMVIPAAGPAGTAGEWNDIRGDVPGNHAVIELPFVTFCENGHAYMIIRPTGGITWDDARTAAESISVLGMQGHLATVTTAGEHQFLLDQLAGTGAVWIGGEQDGGGAWTWITGEFFDGFGWAPGKPDDVGGEDNLEYFALQPGWNDNNGSGLNGGYIVEFALTKDCNQNGVADYLDTFLGTSPDCNANSIPDECDLAGDVDGNGVVDLNDLAAVLTNFGRRVYPAQSCD